VEASLYGAVDKFAALTGRVQRVGRWHGGLSIGGVGVIRRRRLEPRVA